MGDPYGVPVFDDNDLAPSQSNSLGHEVDRLRDVAIKLDHRTFAELQQLPERERDTPELDGHCDRNVVEPLQRERSPLRRGTRDGRKVGRMNGDARVRFVDDRGHEEWSVRRVEAMPRLERSAA